MGHGMVKLPTAFSHNQMVNIVLPGSSQQFLAPNQPLSFFPH